MPGADIKITIDEDSFKESKAKLLELSIIAHAIQAEIGKALENAEILKIALEKIDSIEEAS